MGWTSGPDRSTGDLITAAQWNLLLGSNSSINYLKDYMDYATDVAPTRVLDTEYENDSSQLRLCLVTVTCADGERVEVKTGSSSPPTTVVGRVSAELEAGDWIEVPITFLVKPDWFYKLVSTSTPILIAWREWDLMG